MKEGRRKESEGGKEKGEVKEGRRGEGGKEKGEVKEGRRKER